MEPLNNFINGRWVPSHSSEFIERLDPATGELIARVPAGSAADVDAAVLAAHAAQPAWGSMPVPERTALLHKALDAVAAHAEELAATEALEMGKPVSIGVPFLNLGIAVMRDAADEALSYEFSSRLKEDASGITDVVRKPVGVVAVIVPWNFPLTAALVSISAALAAGNTVVLKPSEKSSISAVRFLELLALPDGVINMVVGDRRAGAPLTEHPLVDLIHFTGSVAAGRQVGIAAGGMLRRVVLELGGKDPVIVDSDVDVEAVAADVARGSFVNSGQICTSMERIYVHRDVAEAFTDELVRHAKEQVLGSPADPSTVMGPMVDEGQRAVVERHVEDALGKGARVLVGGESLPGNGFYYPATVLVDVDESMDIMREETFGPIAPVRVVDSFEEGVELAKSTDYGLGMTVYTNTPAHVEMASTVPTGILWVNAWQGGDPTRQTEPAGQSGMGASGRTLSLDAATRPMAVHTPSSSV